MVGIEEPGRGVDPPAVAARLAERHVAVAEPEAAARHDRAGRAADGAFLIVERPDREVLAHDRGAEIVDRGRIALGALRALRALQALGSLRPLLADLVPVERALVGGAGPGLRPALRVEDAQLTVRLVEAAVHHAA